MCPSSGIWGRVLVLEEGHNHPIVRFAYLCHMIGEELVFFSFLYIDLFELGVEVALNHCSAVSNHKNALDTLQKDLILDDADTLIYHQNKLKQAQNDLYKSQMKKKQDKMLANVARDHRDDRVTAGQNLGST